MTEKRKLGGMEVVLDESVPPDEVQLRDANGTVVARSTIASDPLVILRRGYYEDRQLRTGAVVELMVYPAGARIPLSEARSRNIDDFALVPENEEPPFEYVSGPALSVRDVKLFGE